MVQPGYPDESSDVPQFHSKTMRDHETLRSPFDSGMAQGPGPEIHEHQPSAGYHKSVIVVSRLAGYARAPE
jgi:hypothetical protein